ncbi:MAG: hypothetical protein RLZZ84_1991 [Pseudomonadota bacterium]|jgi:vitamin B12 transporter
MCVKYLFYIGCSVIASAPAVAQGAPEAGAEGQIVVTATGWREPAAQVGQAISVIDTAELERVQGSDITRLLERLPGVSYARNGGLGSTTSLFVRGGDSEQLLVTIDGVRVADVAAPGGGFDLGTLLTGGIGRIELLRGSDSVVWGSDAMTGVLAVTTDTATGLAGSLEYGAHDTLTTQGRAGLSGDRYQLGVVGGYARSAGISAFSGGAEPDGFRQWNVGGNARFDLTDRWAVLATARYADSRIDFDGYPAPDYLFADTPEYQTTRQGSGRAGLAYSGGALEWRGGLALAETRRAYFDPTNGPDANYTTFGRSLRADMAGRLRLPAGFSLDFGADSDWTRFATLYDAQRTARLSSGHALLGWKDSRLSLAAGARIDDHDRFGSHWTFGANGAYQLGAGWRIHASYGEGFKAPSLSQLYGWRGNTALQPETSRSFDAGITLGEGGSPLRFGLTAFHRDSRNLIAYRAPEGLFNIGRARAAGVELEAQAQVSPRLGFRAAYTYVKSTNRLTDTDLARRPRHALSVSADWVTPLAGPLAGLSLGADLRVVGDSFDDPGNWVRLDGYGLVTLRASVPLGDKFELYGRVENVTDAKYQTSADYGTYGRTAYVGARVKW